MQPRIPSCCADIDAAWLNEVLSPEVRDGGTVVAVETEIIGEGVGFLGELGRIRLTYEGAGPNAVRSVIAKLPTTNEGFRHIGTMLGLYRKEHGFYAEVAHQVTISVPTAYHNGGDHDANEYVLLMEDMAPRTPGNQLEGCTRDEAELALRELARFHATWWEHPALDGFAEWLPGPRDPYFHILEQGYLAAMPKVEDVVGHLVGDDVLALSKVIADRYHECLDLGALRPPHTFIHGDFRLDNMMFATGADGLELTLLDWQLPFKANPMWDVVYFLAGNFEPEWRRSHQRELVQLYHDALVAEGVRDYSFERCWEDYRAAAGVLVGYIVTIAGDLDWESLNDRGKAAAEMMVSRYSCAVADLQPSEFLTPS